MYATSYGLPSAPLLRLKNYLEDGPILQKRWVRKSLDRKLFDNSLLIPGDRLMMTKNRDPNWRKRWRWIVLRSDSLDPFHLMILDRELEAQGNMLKLLFALKTPIFAMRVGPRPMRVVVMDVSGQLTIPRLFNPGKDQSNKLKLQRKSELDSFSKMLRQNSFADILEV